MKKEACNCGVDHWWISWRGYQFGPFSGAVAEQIVMVADGASAELVAQAEADPLMKMILGAVLNLPPAVDCK